MPWENKIKMIIFKFKLLTWLNRNKKNIIVIVGISFAPKMKINNIILNNY